ncbi:MAG: hypothetical protein GC154_01480 [bacterium]|nr:hypothetical protein [bacterium]
MSERYDRVKEEILNALIQEYIRQNPGVSEQEVLYLAKDGKLVLSDLASVLAEMKVRKDFNQSLESAGKMYANLAIQENSRWQDCYDSAKHSRLMIDCLHSSPFNHFDQDTWTQEHHYIKRYESICARATVKVESSKDALAEIKKEGVRIQTPRGRMAVITYLQWLIDQMTALYRVLIKEVELGDQFEEHARRYIETAFETIEKNSTPFDLKPDIFNQIYKALEGDAKKTLHVESVSDLNRKLLIETKNSLNQAIGKLKKHTQVRRQQFQEMWTAISTLRDSVKKLEELNNLDRNGKMPPEDPDEEAAGTGSGGRMARFMNTLKSFGRKS